MTKKKRKFQKIEYFKKTIHFTTECLQKEFSKKVRKLMKIKLSVNVRYNRIEESDKCHTFLIFEFTSNIMSTRDIGLEAYLPYTLSLMQFSSFDIFRITRRD